MIIENLPKSFICHRLPDRTFKFNDWYFPVCSRCTGIYLGAFSYFLFAYLFYVPYNPIIISIAVLMVIPTFYDGSTQFIGLRNSNNFLRLFTGLIGGIGLAIFIKAIKCILISMVV